MNNNVLKAWAEKLESGELMQGKGALRAIEPDGEGSDHEVFCCLGVLCEMAVEAKIIPPGERKNWGEDDAGNPIMSSNYHYTNWDGTDRNGAFLPGNVTEWVTGSNTGDLILNHNGYDSTPVQLNDSDDLTFTEIASAIRDTYGV